MGIEIEAGFAVGRDGDGWLVIEEVGDEFVGGFAEDARVDGDMAAGQRLTGFVRKRRVRRGRRAVGQARRKASPPSLRSSARGRRDRA